MNMLIKDSEYKQWLSELKQRIRQSQIKAAIKVNSELRRDLMVEFPNMKGFSIANLRFTKRFYLFYTQDISIRYQLGSKLGDSILHQVGEELQQPDNKQNIIRSQLVDELENHPIFQIPWGHHVQIITKCKSVKEALFYVQKTIQNGWSRAVFRIPTLEGLTR